MMIKFLEKVLVFYDESYSDEVSKNTDEHSGNLSERMAVLKYIIYLFIVGLCFLNRRLTTI